MILALVLATAATAQTVKLDVQPNSVTLQPGETVYFSTNRPVAWGLVSDCQKTGYITGAGYYTAPDMECNVLVEAVSAEFNPLPGQISILTDPSNNLATVLVRVQNPPLIMRLYRRVRGMFGRLWNRDA
jgi:hypothetical protein